MLISKTMFKEYTRCPRVCALDNLYQQKYNSKISFFNDEKAEMISSLLSQMFTEEGDDLIFEIDKKQEALLEYYKDVEKYAIEFVSKKLNIPVYYAKETSKQKRFSFKDENGYEYYCYVDGYFENDNDIYIFEVKATTAHKFYALGRNRKNVKKSDHSLLKYYSIFEFDDKHILRLKSPTNLEGLTLSEYQHYYQKLFDRYTDQGQYIYDIAVERFIIENSLHQNFKKSKKVHYYLVLLNHEYIFDGTYDESGPVYNKDINNQDLFILIDVSDITEIYQEEIQKNKEKLVQYIKELDGNPYPLGVYCERKSQSRCPFVNICWEKVFQKGSILEYTYHTNGFKDLEGNKYSIYDLINQGYTTIQSIPYDWLNRKENQIQRKCYEENKEYINYEKIKLGLSLIQYPIYHLDFEAFACPLPRFKGERPYNQSVFQFSIHVEKEPGVCDLYKDNYYYLAKDQQDRREELIQKLIDIIDLSNGGTVLVYNQSFEQSRLEELMEIFPKYKDNLNTIKEHLFDLFKLVRSNSDLYHKQFNMDKEEAKIFNYYHPNQQGSFSIKKVLPLFSNLSYSDLNIQNGNEALIAYATYHLYEKEDLEDIYNDLIQYCRQDTWAMVVILNGLRKLVNFI